MTNTYPLSPFKQVGGLLFVSGQIGVKDGEIVSNNIRQQTVQTIQNIEAILIQNNLSLKDVVDVTVFLTEQDEYDYFNQEYMEFFKEPYPTRTTVTVKSLPRGAKIEIKVIAEIK